MSGILITGGTGYLGHGLVRRLVELGYRRVRIYSRGEFAQHKMAQVFAGVKDGFGEDPLAFFVGDVRDQARLERAMHDCDYVIHAAALKRIEVGHYNPDEMVKTNVLGTMNVIEAARRAGVKRVVFVSSDKAFAPVSPYGTSKALAEQLVLAANRQSLGPRYVVCRYGNVAGSTGSVIPTWRARIAAGEPIQVTNPDCTRFWMTLDQAVELVLEAFTTDEDLLIPKLPAYRLGDLAMAIGLAGNAQKISTTGLSAWEKQHESMAEGNSSDLATRLSFKELCELLKGVPG